MKFPVGGAELFHTDKRTDRHDEANSRFSQFCERSKKLDREGNRGDWEKFIKEAKICIGL